MNKKNLRFVVALHIEAKPIISLYHLKKYKIRKKKFELYQNLSLNIWLVISGVGNINASEATKHLYQGSPINKKNIWINLGMAGSKNYNLGETFNIKKVTYKSKSYYTSSLVNHIIPTGEIISVDKVEKEFSKQNVLYEMEAYGFMKEVEKFCDREQICIIKLISDNKKNAPINFIKNTKFYINYNLENIEKLIDAHVKIVSNIPDNSNSNLYLIQRKFNLTFSYKIILNDLVLNYQKIYPKNLLEKIIDESKDIKELINALKNKIKIYTLKV